MSYMSYCELHIHMGRSWHGSFLEDSCPCGKAPCGLVDSEKISPDCTQHTFQAAKTMRQIHSASDCPSSTQAVVPLPKSVPDRLAGLDAA